MTNTNEKFNDAKEKFVKLLKHPRMIVLFIFLVLALVAINPSPFNEGVTIKSITKNSSASSAGFEGPKPTQTPLSKEKIISMNNELIKSEQDYYDFVNVLEPGRSIQIKTDKGIYKLVTRAIIEKVDTGKTKNQTIEETITINKTITVNETVFNETLNKNQTITTTKIVPTNTTINKTITVPVYKTNILGTQELGLTIDDVPTTNLRKGLDLQGGTRVLLKPEIKVESGTLVFMIESIKQRLNVYGLSDIIVKEVKDRPSFLGEGESFILVEIAGATEDEVRDLLAKQGKFEAKIGEETVFFGGDDITYVCKTAECSGIDPRRGCGAVADNSFSCGFSFSISLSPEAAQRQADITRNLEIVPSDGGNYLSESLELFLDDSKVDELQISADLRGRATTGISISGSGNGANQQLAIADALKNMKNLQTVMITGSLPVKLDIVKIDNISPLLGEKFIKNIFEVAIIALLAVALTIFGIYRSWKIALPMLLTLASEVIIVLGFAALFGQFLNLDLASIAGIIVIIGTGVDHLVVITDEVLQGTEEGARGWAKKIKSAFFIIMAAYFTTFVAMLPLIFAGAGLLKGFAITTIVGVSIGVFITRPAFAAVVEILLKE